MKEKAPTGQDKIPFPGSDLFAPEQAEKLSALIQQMHDTEAEHTRSSYTGPGWNSNGYPDYEGLDTARTRVLYIGCAGIALETIRHLNGDVSQINAKDISAIIGRSLIYDEIPQRTHMYLQQRQNAPTT